jgi:putative transposase
MARPLRVEFEGALYHLTGRGNARQRIFADKKDCAKFVELLVESLQRYDVALQAYQKGLLRFKLDELSINV